MKNRIQFDFFIRPSIHLLRVQPNTDKDKSCQISPNSGTCSNILAMLFTRVVQSGVSNLELTWGSPCFVMTQLSPAVRATCVHTAIIHKKHRVLASTGDLFHSPATEHMTVPRLKHRVLLHTNTQLPILGIPPAQHVGEGRGNEHRCEEAKRVTARWRKTIMIKLESRPAFASSCKFQP